jgi:hypothetical protein
VRIAGEVAAGDLEGVEEETGTAGIDVVGGDASDDLAEGILDVGAATGCWKQESVAPSLPLLRVGDGATGGVVVVAKFFSAEGRTATMTSIGPGVAAEIVLRRAAVFDLLDSVHYVLHDDPSPLDSAQSLRNRRDEGGLQSRSFCFRVKRKSPAVSRASALSSLI